MMKYNLITLSVIVMLLSITLVVSAPIPIGKDAEVSIDLTTAEKNNLTRWNITEPEVKTLPCSLLLCKTEVKALENGKNVTLTKLVFRTYYSYPRYKYIGKDSANRTLYELDTPRIKILTQAEIEEMRIVYTEFVIKKYIADRVESEKPSTPKYEDKVGEGKVIIR